MQPVDHTAMLKGLLSLDEALNLQLNKNSLEASIHLLELDVSPETVAVIISEILRARKAE